MNVLYGPWIVDAELLIVGGSAAGLAAAISAARAGVSVHLVEAKREIGDPPAPAIVGFDHLWPAQIERPPEAVRRRLEGIRLRGTDGRGPLVDAPLTLFDRARFDRHLTKQAIAAGARIETGVRFDELAQKPRVLLFADGANSAASRYLTPVRDPSALAYGAILDVRAPGDDPRLSLTLGPHAPGGRSQLNPLGDGRWSHWTFFRGDPQVAEDVARAALAIDARIMGWKDVDARFIGIAADPVYTIPRELARGNVLVAGGAAGQGGLEVGLASGWMAGEAAARAIQHGAPLTDYERAWRARYQKGYERLRAATDALTSLTDAEERALLGAWDGARVRPDLRSALAHPRGMLALARAGWLAWARG